MEFLTPAEIELPAWRGELAPGEPQQSEGGWGPLAAVLAKLEAWPVSVALADAPRPYRQAAMGLSGRWLVRLGCGLPAQAEEVPIAEAQLTLHLRPRNRLANDTSVYVASLFPERMGVEERLELVVGLGMDLKFSMGEDAVAESRAARIFFRKVYPVIQSFGTGETAPYWIFRPHGKRNLEGSQFVYAVLIASPRSEGITGYSDLAVSVETPSGKVRYHTPRGIDEMTHFEMP